MRGFLFDIGCCSWISEALSLRPAAMRVLGARVFERQVVVAFGRATETPVVMRVPGRGVRMSDR
jgi:hypothetical protein